MKLRRIQSQNFANSLHKNTLQRLADRALGTDGFTQLTKLTREEGQIKYFGPGDTEAESSLTNVLNVLAQTEHLRWTASHQILGYRSQSGYDKDETRLLHGCLKPWQELTTDFQVYDYNVVDVSLGINNNIINH